MPVVAVATITPAPEHREAVLAALEESIPVVHEEPGCELYALHQSQDAFVMIEQWADGDALKAHGSGDAFRALSAALEDKLAAPLDLTLLEPLPLGTPERGRLV